MKDGFSRILEPDGKIAPGKKPPKLDGQTLVRIYRLMLLNRRVDERMIKLQRQGRLNFYVSSIGEEAAIVPSAMALQDEDWIVPCYREFGATLVRGWTLTEYFCHLMGNAKDIVKGRQMPNHYALRDRRITSISSPVGTQIPQATGLAMGLKIQKKKEIVLVYFGDGSTSQGDFHVGMNFAGVFESPIVFLCRNNQWAISVPSERQTASESFAIKARAYGFEGLRVDGNDALAVYAAVSDAVRKARKGQGPTLIEAVTYRQGGHSTSDDPRAYRDAEEVDRWLALDPLTRFKALLVRKRLWDDEKDEALNEEIKTEIQTALKEAEAQGPPPLESIFEDVFETLPWNLREQLEEARSLQAK